MIPEDYIDWNGARKATIINNGGNIMKSDMNVKYDTIRTEFVTETKMTHIPFCYESVLQKLLSLSSKRLYTIRNYPNTHGALILVFSRIVYKENGIDSWFIYRNNGKGGIDMDEIPLPQLVKLVGGYEIIAFNPYDKIECALSCVRYGFTENIKLKTIYGENEYYRQQFLKACMIVSELPFGVYKAKTDKSWIKVGEDKFTFSKYPTGYMITDENETQSTNFEYPDSITIDSVIQRLVNCELDVIWCTDMEKYKTISSIKYSE